MPPTIRPLALSDLLKAAFVVAEAFAGPGGVTPERYSLCATIMRLAASLDAPATPWTPRYLVADLDDGRIVAIGGYARSRAAGSTWELLLGATLPAYQGRGIGHALVLARLDAIRAEATDGGLVMVSTKRPARFIRYGFAAGPVNPDTGATLMWAAVPAGGRAAA